MAGRCADRQAPAVARCGVACGSAGSEQRAWAVAGDWVQRRTAAVERLLWDYRRVARWSLGKFSRGVLVVCHEGRSGDDTDRTFTAM